MKARNCNHNGPMFDRVKELHPHAAAFHWFENAFNTADKCWLVAYHIECGGGVGKEWRKVTLESLSQ